MPFYDLITGIMLPETRKGSISKEYITEDAKLASIRITKNVLFKNNLKAIYSKKLGWSEENIVEMFLHGVKDRSGPPKHEVAY